MLGECPKVGGASRRAARLGRSGRIQLQEQRWLRWTALLLPFHSRIAAAIGWSRVGTGQPLRADRAHRGGRAPCAEEAARNGRERHRGSRSTIVRLLAALLTRGGELSRRSGAAAPTSRRQASRSHTLSGVANDRAPRAACGFNGGPAQSAARGASMCRARIPPKSPCSGALARTNTVPWFARG